PAGVDHGQRAAALHLQHVVGPDEGGGVLVQADADRERVEGQRRDQAAEAVALAEVLVDDEAIGQAEPGRQPHAARARRRALLAERDHVLAEDAGAGAGAADGHPARVALADQLGRGRPAHDGRDAQLVAAGEEHAGGGFQLAQVVLAAAVLAAGEADRARAPGLEPVEQFLVALAGVRQLAGGGNDRDVGVTPAAQLHEALENAAPHLLVLGPADRDDPATFLALGDPAWTHCGTDSSCRSPAACWPGPGAARAPPRRAGTAVAAAKIASFAAIAGAGVPAVGALDLRHPDLEMAVPARTALLARGGVL